MRQKRATDEKKCVNYYPFGLKHKGYNNITSSLGNSTAQKFKYNGKEFNEELGLNMYDYGARMYDPSVGKWFSVDAMAEKYYDQSVYEYTLNNPIIYIDPDGNQVEVCCWDEFKDIAKGVFIGVGETFDKLTSLDTYVVTVDEAKSRTQEMKEQGMSDVDVVASSFGVVKKPDQPETSPSLQQTVADITKTSIAIGAVSALSKTSAKVKTTNSNTTGGIVVTEKVISEALKDSSMKTIQSEVSLPVIQNYVNKILKKEVAPPIKVDNGVLIDGNHRYIAGAIAGKLPAQVPSVLPRSMRPLVKPISEIKINPIDFGNR